MSSDRHTIALTALFVAIVALVVAGRWRSGPQDALLTTVPRKIERVMGTESLLKAIVPMGEADRADRALRKAEQALRRVELAMSTYIKESELSRLNTAKPGELVPLSPDTLEVLRISKDMHARTRGTFDVTVRPVIELWKQAKREQHVPTRRQLQEAVESSSWDKLRLETHGATRTAETVTVDLGGIAKGYGIDKAVEAMKATGIRGGLVDVGGDVRCFGARQQGGRWVVGIRDPFSKDRSKTIAKIGIADQAVCTSGNYERHSTIRGKRYSHIIDPRTGDPVDSAPSVTVVAPTATIADAWATALSVLGPEVGLGLIDKEPGVEAMLLVGSADVYKPYYSAKFEEMLLTPVREPGTVGRMRRTDG